MKRSLSFLQPCLLGAITEDAGAVWDSFRARCGDGVGSFCFASIGTDFAARGTRMAECGNWNRPARALTSLILGFPCPCLGCYNENALGSWAYKQQIFICHIFGGWGAPHQDGSKYSVWLRTTSWFTEDTFFLCPRMMEGTRELPGDSYKRTLT